MLKSCRCEIVCSYCYCSKTVSAYVNADNNTLVTIYPNPASKTVYILNEGAAYIPLVILDINGKEMVRKNLGKNLNAINISHLPKGLYFLQYQVNGITQTSKITIQ